MGKKEEEKSLREIRAELLEVLNKYDVGHGIWLFKDGSICPHTHVTPAWSTLRLKDGPDSPIVALNEDRTSEDKLAPEVEQTLTFISGIARFYREAADQFDDLNRFLQDQYGVEATIKDFVQESDLH